MLTSRHPETGVTELPAGSEERAAGAALPPRLRPPLRGGGVLRLERRRPGRGQAGHRHRGPARARPVGSDKYLVFNLHQHPSHTAHVQ